MSGDLREYHRPKEWETAQGLLQRNNGRAKPLFMSPRPSAPDQWPVDIIVDLSNLGLDTIVEESGCLKIGSLSSLQSIIDSKQVNNRFDGILSSCVRCSGSFSIRNYANLGGVLTDAAAPSDFLLALLALDAAVILRKLNDQTVTVKLSSFLKANRKLEPGEIVCGVQVRTDVKGAFALERISRTPKDTAIIAVFARLEIEEGLVIAARIAASGASAHPARVEPVEKLLTNQVLTPQRLQLGSRIAEDWAKPQNDLWGSAEYRRAMLGVMVHRAIQSVWKRTA